MYSKRVLSSLSSQTAPCAREMNGVLAMWKSTKQQLPQSTIDLDAPIRPQCTDHPACHYSLSPKRETLLFPFPRTKQSPSAEPKVLRDSVAPRELRTLLFLKKKRRKKAEGERESRTCGWIGRKLTSESGRGGEDFSV